MHHHMTSRLLLVATAAATLATACAEDPNVPPAGVPGSYHATAFSLASGGPALDLLASGASLTMTLASNHMTTGRLVIPAEFAGGSAVDESLAGTWRQSNDTVYFDGPADTFVRDVPFVVRGATLAAEYDPPGGQLLVTLMKYGLD